MLFLQKAVLNINLTFPSEYPNNTLC